jgi:sirohydrochlorin cobaltochelatase
MSLTSRTSQEARLQALDAKLKAILPAEYQACYEDIQPIPMRSAGLVFDAAGRVAWDEIWGSFCDLAMAGGPPHKGTLLQPGTPEQIAAEPARYRTAVDEICRGIRMVCESVAVNPSPDPGWVRVSCAIPGMAGWLVRAIAMENVSVRTLNPHQDLDLPAGPHYRLEKEIKNVITVIAKTSHYFAHHMESGRQQAIAEVFAAAEASSPLLQPAPHACKSSSAERVLETTGFQQGSGPIYPGWLGLECSRVSTAIWMMRALVASNNMLARREGTVLYVPLNPDLDPAAEILIRALLEVRELAHLRGI